SVRAPARWCSGTGPGAASARCSAFGRLSPDPPLTTRAASPQALLALDLSQPVRGRPPLNEEHRGLVVEAGGDDFRRVGVELAAVRSFGDRSGSDRATGDLRFARPLCLRSLDRVDRGTMQGEPWIAAEIRAFARVRHRAKDQLAVLEDRLNPGDPR